MSLLTGSLDSAQRLMELMVKMAKRWQSFPFLTIVKMKIHSLKFIGKRRWLTFFIVKNLIDSSDVIITNKFLQTKLFTVTIIRVLIVLKSSKEVKNFSNFDVIRILLSCFSRFKFGAKSGERVLIIVPMIQ